MQHRSVIKYSADSPRDFEELRIQIETRMRAKLERREKLGQVTRIQSVAKVEGLDQHHIATLVSVAEGIGEPSERVSAYQIRQAMEGAGFTKIATTLGLKALLDNGMLEYFEDDDDRGETFIAYSVTDRGMTWLLENQGKIALKQEPRVAPIDDDIPF
ncbi:MAG: hypothetical protein KJ749_06860 [Planctomycetes bacterium]|nr:hypothetical protein [Planctomycetota bacterium]